VNRLILIMLALGRIGSAGAEEMLHVTVQCILEFFIYVHTLGFSYKYVML
jgi:hypothetical protein